MKTIELTYGQHKALINALRPEHTLHDTQSGTVYIAGVTDFNFRRVRRVVVTDPAATEPQTTEPAAES
jgi:hypothetical protein